MKGKDPASDGRLLRRARTGDRAAVGALLHAHGSRLQRQLTALLGPAAPVEDLVQETFIVALRRFPSFRGESRIGTWLHGIALNVARNHRAKLARRSRLDAELPVPATTFERTPEDDAVSREALRRLHVAMEVLSEDEREAFVLRVVEEIPIAEVASLLGVPASTVSERATRARSRVRERLTATRAGGEGETAR